MSDEQLSGRCILVVEDDYFLAFALKRMLLKSGAIVLGPAPSVKQALDLLAVGEAPDAAVLDVSLEGEPVFPVADVLQARGVPFLFTTGFSDTIVPEQQAMVRWLVKPIASVVMLREIGLLLKKG